MNFRQYRGLTKSFVFLIEKSNSDAQKQQQLKSESMDTQAASVDKISPPTSPETKDSNEGDRKQSFGNILSSKMFSLPQVTSAAQKQQQQQKEQQQQQTSPPQQQQSGGGFFGFFKRSSVSAEKKPLEKQVH